MGKGTVITLKTNTELGNAEMQIVRTSNYLAANLHAPMTVPWQWLIAE